uniref:Uncharacterized protein n=1 Tax=Cyprinus carpio TaxID=7962 RepID=A0A8C1VER9_CYPCA
MGAKECWQVQILVYLSLLTLSALPLSHRSHLHIAFVKFGDDVIFQDDNASCHGAKTKQQNSLDLNPIENVCWKWKKLVHDKALSCKADLSTAIEESWNQLDEEYCFSLVNSMPQRIQAVLKARGGATKY